MLLLFYILKSSVCLTIAWLFYQVILRRLTFYTWNRWFLLVCSALSFLLPLIDVSSLLEKNNWTASRFVSAIPPMPDYQAEVVTQNIPLTTQPLYITVLPWLLTLGASVLLIRLLVQYLSLLSMRRSARLLLQGPVNVYQVDKPVIPFSFGNAIYLNQHLHEENELKEIIRHEFIHVKQRHTIDIIWSELVCLLTWCNPFAWLLRKAIRQNLEFIADQQVLKTGFDRRQYQYLLLKVIGVPSYSIASNFNFKSLKKRIAMMNKVKSAKVHLVRFLLLLPVVAVILIAFRNAGNNRQQPVEAGLYLQQDTVPRAGALPDNVSSYRQYNNRVTVTLKNGKEEKYNLDNEEERKAFEKKYGKMPEPPLPPTSIEMAAPPVAPTAVAAPVMAPPKAPVAMAMPAAPVPAEAAPSSPPGAMAVPMPPTPPPAPVRQWPKNVSGVHIRNNKVTVTLTDGKTEHYDLNKPEEKAKYESKYGNDEEVPGIDEHEMAAVAAVGHPVATAHAAMASPGAHQPAVVDEVLHAPAMEARAVAGVPIVQEPNAEDELLGVIKRTTTQQDLDQLKKELAEKGVKAEWKIVSEKDGGIDAFEGKLHDDNNDCHFKVDSFSSIVIFRTKNKQGKSNLLVRIDERVKRS